MELSPGSFECLTAALSITTSTLIKFREIPVHREKKKKNTENKKTVI